jgi:hypothetical protein
MSLLVVNGFVAVRAKIAGGVKRERLASRSIDSGARFAALPPIR